MKSRRDLLYLFLLLVLEIFFWLQALEPGMVFFLRDLSEEIAPKRFFWSQSGGFVLWSPHSFFGMPYAANPQSEAFYPLNFIFLLWGAERGLVYYIVSHHLFFLLTLYWALRRLGFSSEAGLAGSIGFGFGGYLISLSLLPVVFSTVSWLPLLIVFLKGAAEGRWLMNSLLAGLALTMQILAGEVQVAAMTWMLALAATVFSPGNSNQPGDFAKAAGAFAFGLAWAAILSLPQIMLSRELVSLSNRGPGLSLAEAFAWPIQLSALKSLLIPNHLLPLSSGVYWGLGFFSGFPYFLSLYLGAVLLIFAIFSFAGPYRWKAFFWLVLSVFGLAMMLGESTPVYGFFYRYLPRFNLFRIPLKFLVFLNFGLLVMALFGFEHICERRWNRPAVSLLLVLAGTALLVLLLVFPVRFQEFGDKYQEIADFLMLRTALRVLGLVLVSLGLMLMIGIFQKSFAGTAFALLVFADLYFAHHWQNPATGPDFYQPNSFIRELKAEPRNPVVPPRVFDDPSGQDRFVMLRAMDPVIFYGKARDSLRGFWSAYFGIDNIGRVGSLYPAEAAKFRSLLADSGWSRARLILARAGVEYIYFYRTGFTGLTGSFPRASVFYQAKVVPGRDQAVSIWSDPNFPAAEILLLEQGQDRINGISGLDVPDPAEIVQYGNEKVVVDSDAKRDGWLLLLDLYYPGWKAEVDGKPVEILRAHGFFRAVRIPAGRHRVVFSYHPDIFYQSALVSGIGLIIWLMLLVFSFFKPKTRL